MQGYSELHVFFFLGEFLSECSLDLLDALKLFIFAEDKCCLLSVERRVLPEVAIWAAYLIHFSNSIVQTIQLEILKFKLFYTNVQPLW